MKTNAFLTFSLLITLAAVAAHAVEIVKTMDVRYAEAPAGTDANLLSLDIYAPRDTKHLPVMIYIHGGGWRKGDKSEVDAKPEYFTARGFVFVSINYRLVPGVDIVTQLQDSANAIGWVSAHIAEHGGDPARLHLIGHSAGGHHVALLATNERFLKNAGVPLERIASVVELDVEALDVPKVMTGSDGRRTSTFGTDENVWREISPFHHVAGGKGVPPFLIVVTGRAAPERVAAKRAQSEALQAALRAAGVRCELVEAAQHDHNSLNRAIGVRDDAITQAMEKFHDSILTPTSQ